MSTQVYEKLFLVNNIPKIEGILQVRDMIKGYAYTGEMNMIRHMKRAKEYSKKFKYVNMAILQAYSRRNPIGDNHDNCTRCLNRKDFDIYKQSWSWGFDEYQYNERWQHCRIIDFDLDNKCKEVFIEENQMISGNCYLCGEYIPYFVNHWYNIPYCCCAHNDYLYHDDDIDNDNDNDNDIDNDDDIDNGIDNDNDNDNDNDDDILEYNELSTVHI
jgi:hypothetical protein